MKTAKYLALIATINFLFALPVSAEQKATKSELRAMAVETCLNEAQNRYGENSVVDSDELASVYRDASRVRWNRGLKGMMVKMKIKPDSKRKAKYTCVVKTDKSVQFFKA